ncbi:ECF RNA polymerase sigma factor RpoE [Vibrio aerogenes CECT 7868]|uniref:ECF RNA polymerase sigma factor RpoE n=1 Tax=Vibrio aerogenes CECT 7868 TaxID=1216006 RepID=A0A1M6A4F8_9VIBR|nr:sigma-70 family RNA polymerase sigma factor [Vibrio aerogenes]SHI31404.1 ECF RNA polymerase sigma factor RpoE [Vibrio aerogenes CECT 7868]
MVEQSLSRHHVASLLSNIAESRCKQSFEQLFTMIAPMLLNYMRQQLQDDALACEIVQETMLKIWMKAHLYDESKGAATTWIYSVARNVKFDTLRKLKHHNDWIQGDDLWPVLSEESEPGQLPAEFHAIVRQELNQIIDTLPRSQSVVVRMICLQGESHQSVAQALDVPLGTVKSRLRLALNKMKEALDD